MSLLPRSPICPPGKAGRCPRQWLPLKSRKKCDKVFYDVFGGRENNQRIDTEVKSWDVAHAMIHRVSGGHAKRFTNKCDARQEVDQLLKLEKKSSLNNINFLVEKCFAKHFQIFFFAKKSRFFRILLRVYK